MYAIKVNENIKDIESIDTPFNVDFYGSLMVMIDLIDDEYKVINAMNGYGNNCINEYSDAKVIIFESLPAERIVMPKIAEELDKFEDYLRQKYGGYASLDKNTANIAKGEEIQSIFIKFQELKEKLSNFTV